jgi:hypothetical protein
VRAFTSALGGPPSGRSVGCNGAALSGRGRPSYICRGRRAPPT